MAKTTKTEQAVELRAQGLSTEQIARKMKTSTATVNYMLSRYDNKQQEPEPEEKPVKSKKPFKLITPSGTITIDGDAHVTVSRDAIRIEW